MPTCHVYIATSLDGYIARLDGDIEWLHQWADIGDDYGYGAFMQSVDGLIIGRGTFDTVQKPWVKRVPDAASASRRGVRTTRWP